MWPIASRICTRGEFISMGLRVSFRNRQIGSFRIFSLGVLKAGRIAFDVLTRPSRRLIWLASTLPNRPQHRQYLAQNESARERLGIQGRHIRFYRLRGFGWLGGEVR